MLGEQQFGDWEMWAMDAVTQPFRAGLTFGGPALRACPPAPGFAVTGGTPSGTACPFTVLHSVEKHTWTAVQNTPLKPTEGLNGPPSLFSSSSVANFGRKWSF